MYCDHNVLENDCMRLHCIVSNGRMQYSIGLIIHCTKKIFSWESQKINRYSVTYCYSGLKHMIQFNL